MMGAFLEKPKTEKVYSSGEGNGIRYGVSAMQGWRLEMEDAHICEMNMALGKGHSFFGVFDGHAGPKVAKFCSEKLLEYIVKEGIENGPDSIKKGFVKGFLKLDMHMKEKDPWVNGLDHSGSTAIVVMLTPEKIIWGNCGDSRGICASKEVQFATTDHKPYNTPERQRIEKAGGTVMMQRVNGSLAVSRALGDFDYKRANHLPAVEQLVSPEPEVTVLDRDLDNDHFLILACDGIFDVMSNEEVAKYVSHQLEITDDLPKICNSLIDLCLNKNSRDNMSVILVTFPAAPKVSEAAIEKEKKQMMEAKELIEKRLKIMVKDAVDPMDLEDNYVLQQLTVELDIELASMKNEILASLVELRTAKFGQEESFIGSSDPADAPANFDSGIDSAIDDLSPDAQTLLSLSTDSDTAVTDEPKDSIPNKTIM